MKKFTITCEYDDESGHITVNTKAEGGITPLEIIGLLELKRLDMFNQLTNNTLFNRMRVNPDGSMEKIEEKEPEE